MAATYTRTTGSLCSYRKTRDGWAAYGTASTIEFAAKHRQAVNVRAKSGKVEAKAIARASRPFLADGVQMAYGYFA